MISGRLIQDSFCAGASGKCRVVILHVVFFSLNVVCWAAQNIGVDLDGRHIDPLQVNAGRVVVLVFVREDCPLSGRYAPTIQRLSNENEKRARFYLVFPDKSESPSSIRKYLSDFRYSIAALRDREHLLVRAAHAQITPEAAVFDSKGVLVYHGRIDDLYGALGQTRPVATTHELQDAIQAVLSGHSPSQKEVKGVGCYISDLD